MSDSSELTKRCNVCHDHLSIDLFYRAQRGLHKRQGTCKKCAAARQRREYRENPERILAYSQRYLAERRQAILDALGGRCASCGYGENVLGIEIDHIDEDGHIERGDRRSGESRLTTYRNMLRDIEAGTARLQLLCGTCHCIKTRTARMRKAS